MENKEITIKVGLEIHQQLDTNKLFCRCPSVIRQDAPDYTIERELHAIAGELGEVDEAVKFEASKNKKFIYQGYYDNICLVDCDESPPMEIDPEAIKVALQLALLLNCEIIPYTQIMRKTVIDGSNTSGFQRTFVLAKNGWVETPQGKVGIQSLMLEEDAARIIKQEKNQVTYRLDRLGIPLVEIATMPDIKSAEQAREVALHIGDILRACKVKRGLGTIRQDVNISAGIDGKWGKRVEIKGVQDPDLIKRTIELEVQRQTGLIKNNKSESEVRKANEDGTTTFLRPMPGQSRMYPETDLPILHITRDMINQAKETLPKLRSEIKDELRKHGLNEELVKVLLQENRVEDFRELLEVLNKPDLIGKMLTVWQLDIAKKLNKSESEVKEKLTLDILETILQAIGKTITESDIQEIMKLVVEGKNVKEALKREKIENLDEEILKIIKEKPGLNPNAYMGLVMQKFKGKVSGKEVMEILSKLVKK